MAQSVVDREPARAKVNLYLHVVGRRADGYHDLDSLVAFADFGDELTVSPADDLSLRVEGAMAAALAGEDDNLALRAARLLADEFAVDAGAAIGLCKTLPVAAGLGGGSADAAAALRLLSRYWRLSPPSERLQRLALTLGADVPVCLLGRPARMGGIGDRLEPLSAFPALPLVLANPGLPVATPDVFHHSSVRSGLAAWPRQGLGDSAGLLAFLAGCGNDLQPAAEHLVPEIALVAGALAGSEGCRIARMSGSGASCFGLFLDAAQADAAARRLRRDHPAWWVAAGRLAGAGP